MLEADRARDEAEKAGRDLNRILNENELGYFCVTDRSGLILQANRAEAQLLGYDSSDELKDRVNRLALLEDQEARRAIELQLEQAGAGAGPAQHPAHAPAGGLRHFLTNLRALRGGDDGEIPGYEGIVDRDITAEVLLDQEKQRENALRDGFNEAFSSSAKVAEFFSAILEVGARQSAAGRGALLLVGDETEIPAKAPGRRGDLAAGRAPRGARLHRPASGPAQCAVVGAGGPGLRPLPARRVRGPPRRRTARRAPPTRFRWKDLDGEVRGLVLLRGPRMDPAELAQRDDALSRFLTRVTVGYPLVHRAELRQRIKREIRNFLSAGELEAQMQEVVAWLRTELPHRRREARAAALERGADEVLPVAPRGRVHAARDADHPQRQPAEHPAPRPWRAAAARPGQADLRGLSCPS